MSALESLYSNPDTRMIRHACSLSKNHDRIVIHTDDIDVLDLLVYYCSRGELVDHVYMYAGHSGKECYIPVNQIEEMLGSTVFECLLAAHDLTRCDTPCSLNRKGKKTSYSKLVMNADD